MRRHTEAWRDSLRYGQPDLDKMAGLRRITINNNPLVGNQGAQVLAEALKDDLWVKGYSLFSFLICVYMNSFLSLSHTQSDTAACNPRHQ